MKITLQATATIDTVGREISARIWEGTTEHGVPVKAWVVVIQPQTDDESLLAAFAEELKEVPAQRDLVSFDIRFAL